MNGDNGRRDLLGANDQCRCDPGENTMIQPAGGKRVRVIHFIQKGEGAIGVSHPSYDLDQ